MPTMTEARFRALVSEAETIGDDYASGYLRGLRRLYHGEAFGDPGEHERWMALPTNDPDRSRADRALGYQDGFAGERPKWPCEVEGCGRRVYAKDRCEPHYRRSLRDSPTSDGEPVRGPRGQLGAEPLVPLSLRVPEAVREAAQEDPAGARAALVAWMKRR